MPYFKATRELIFEEKDFKYFIFLMYVKTTTLKNILNKLFAKVDILNFLEFFTN